MPAVSSDQMDVQFRLSIYDLSNVTAVCHSHTKKTTDQSASC